ncbi:DUF2569 family protein [Actinoplanes bogorensis]|uniref:DUF2569 family protein n=1 Tax=Paractinoplanes bogorensis TaxID=1610840 RepID=A0ABS5YQ85_9ACTN|nr:DUF2569 family protein [Actinoplanes bogorensis]MBU2665491.1 DUF2569 family protein [Actinoplanes bogorensis]
MVYVRSQVQRVPIRGWLVVYLVALGGSALHGLALTIGSLVVAADPSRAGLVSFVPAASLAVYVVTNALLVLYTVVLYVLVARRRRSAIGHNVVFHVLSLVFLAGWHLLGMKSTVGLAIDAVPPVVMAAYILTSERVRRTLREPELLDY